jgi:uncharacterized protein YecT (DUF1311 family)
MPFKKNDPRINRKGRTPLGTTLAEYLRKIIEETDNGKKQSIADEMMMMAIARAKRGQFQYWDAIMNRAYGKVPDKVEMTSQEKPDLSKLTKEELETWMRLLAKAKPSQ